MQTRTTRNPERRAGSSRSGRGPPVRGAKRIAVDRALRFALLVLALPALTTACDPAPRGDGASLDGNVVPSSPEHPIGESEEQSSNDRRAPLNSDRDELRRFSPPSINSWIELSPGSRDELARRIVAVCDDLRTVGITTERARHEFPVLVHRRSGIELVVVPTGRIGPVAPPLLEPEIRDAAVLESHELFLIAATEVTQRQWMRVAEANPSLIKAPEMPVHNVSWSQAVPVQLMPASSLSG